MVKKLSLVTIVALACSSIAYAEEPSSNSDCPSGQVVSCFADGGCFCANQGTLVEPDAGSAEPGCDDADDNGVCD